VKTSYEQTIAEDLGDDIPSGAGEEIGGMYQFSSDFAYDAF
jgi:hypothetical protein